MTPSFPSSNPWARLLLWSLALALNCGPSFAALCSSDGQVPPTGLMERFISADCERCWALTSPPAPAPGTGVLALDWLVPSAAGDDAPLSAAATRDSLARLEALALPLPAKDNATVRRASAARQTQAALALRVAMGPALNGYAGASIELTSLPATGFGTAWLALVETIPAGTDGTPVERNLVRNLFSSTWDGRNQLSKPEQSRWFESRPMGVHEGAQAARLRVVGWVEDERQRLLAVAVSGCEPDAAEVSGKT